MTPRAPSERIGSRAKLATEGYVLLDGSRRAGGQRLSRHSLFHSPEAATSASTGHFAMFLPVFKTGRAGQPPAWKVRFLRRSVTSDGCHPSDGLQRDSGRSDGLSPL